MSRRSVPFRSATFAALLCAAMLSAPAAADPRLVERMYDPSEVVQILGKPKVQATIQFGEGESIENVAIGDSQAWQVTPNKRANLLFVKPLSANGSTNMTVVTNKRTYLFDLVSSPRNRPIYVMKFLYPPEPEEAEPQLAEGNLPGATEAELTAARDPYAVVDPANLNFAWKREGDAALLPVQAFDDGDATFLTWAGGAAVPAILVTDQKGTEGPVNFTVRGDTIVLNSVPPFIILRSGQDMAKLTNTGPVRPAQSPRTAASPARTQSADGRTSQIATPEGSS
ncbi:Protein virB9 [Alteripontixanthobacter maritimus]|uniref:Protein virB9 n=1 Tax=Alteripontixanthobacter maritimus TaxID=2161824 RepID=A0A369Q4G3_9SPHN|nr:TrbG/VirB9 family P-type conjugative transfer protein [Alteripontixanthobacter maritimus]RDC59382.1 Protein virB9 [Alteripontixanthobacter maritimus]